MAEHELPPNVNDWPSDPYELLGVDREADLRAIKKAYARLIRKYKPDFYPQEFARIRAAYELLQDWHAQPEHPWHSPIVTVFSNPTPSRQPREPIIDPAVTPQTPESSGPSSTARSYWDLAGEDIEEAYSRLNRLTLSRREDPDLFLRLFWLLKLQPSLDDSRSPGVWLFEAMQHSPDPNELLQLYTFEIAVNPLEAISSRAANLLRQQTDVSALFQLAQSRWRGCVELAQSEPVREDLLHLANHVLDLGVEAWLRLVLLAAEQLAWCPDKAGGDVLDTCRGLIEQYPEFHLKLEQELGRFDFLVDLSEEYRRLNADPSFDGRDLLKLLPAMWHTEGWTMRPALMEIAGSLLQQPARSLRVLDKLESRGARLHYTLCSLVRRLAGGQMVDFSHLERPQQQWIINFFDDRGSRPYAWLREPILLFCLQEHLVADEVAHATSQVIRIGTHGCDEGNLTAHIQQDGSLHLLCQLHRMYWS